jgi:membrane-bound lytic murein transglycosylase B
LSLGRIRSYWNGAIAMLDFMPNSFSECAVLESNQPEGEL